MKLKKTKKQKGGSNTVVNASKVKSKSQEEIDYGRAITYLDINGLTHIKELFITTFGKNKKISFNSYLRDTFIQGNLLNQDSNFYHEWYKGINPDFKIISQLKSKDESGNEIEFRLPEFRIFVSNLAKDLLMMILYSKFNDSNETNNNKEKYLNNISKQINFSKRNNIKEKLSNNNAIFTKRLTKMKKKYLNQVKDTKINNTNILETLLKNTNNIIGLNYIYIEVQNLYLEFIKLVSIDDDECSNYTEEIKHIYYYTPFIVYPSYWTLDFKEVVNLCSTPILNFKYMNRRRIIHNDFHDPCDQIKHDINFHSKISHSFHNYFTIYNNNNNNKKKKYSEMKIYFKNYFITMNSILTNLNEFYNYNEKIIKKYGKHVILNNKDKISYESLDDNLKKLSFGLVLFYILHEHHKLDNNIEYFSKTGKIIQFIDLKFNNIGNNKDPNAPTTKYPIVETIEWKSVYDALHVILGKILDEIKVL